MKDWRTNKYSRETALGSLNISRSIFQGDSLSPLALLVMMILLKLVPHKMM